MTGVILAGGRSRRMGGQDKALMPFAGRPLIEWVIDALTPQVDSIMISANRHLEAYAKYAVPVVPDREQGFLGPLAGVLSAMLTARTQWILTLPCDGPRPPPDLCSRLASALAPANGDIAVAKTALRAQPVHALLPVALSEDLRAFMAAGGRRVECWQELHRIAWADFSDQPACFANLNSPEDRLRLEQAFMDHQTDRDGG